MTPLPTLVARPLPSLVGVRHARSDTAAPLNVDWRFLGGWLETLLSASRRQKRTDGRIADGARQLLRQLGSISDRPDHNVSGHDLSAWAACLFKGLQAAEPGLKALAGLRPEASPYVQYAIGKARDHLEQATALLAGFFGKDFRMTAWDDDRRAGMDAALRRVLRHVHECRKALWSVDERP